MLFRKEATMFNCSRNVAVNWLQISYGPNLLKPINFSRLTFPLVHTYVVHTNRLINFVFDCISLLMRLFVCIFYSKSYIPSTLTFYKSPRARKTLKSGPSTNLLLDSLLIFEIMYTVAVSSWSIMSVPKKGYQVQ